MDALALVFQSILDLGAAVFLPIIIFILGLIVGLKPGKALSAGLMLGVALTGINLVVSYMSTTVGTAAQAFVENTGVQLTGLDMGWAPALGLCWNWKYAFLMFPVQIGINVIMLVLGWTKTLNVDMWNVANKIFTAFLVASVTGSAVLGFAAAIIQIVLELKNADATKNQITELTGVPGISMPHPMFLSNIIFYPFAKLLDKIPFMRYQLNAATLKDKLGIFGENHVLGFIVGTIVGLVGDTSKLDMRQLAEYKLRTRLLAIPGVGQVTVLGGRLPEYQVIYDPNKLKLAGVDLSSLKTAVQESQSSVPAGYLEDVAGQELPIQQDTRTANIEQLNRALVPDHASGILRLQDVAEVKIDGAPRRGDAGFMGEDAVVLSVQKVPGANTLALTQAVDAAVREFSQSQLPKGMKLHTTAYRQADFIEMSLDNGTETLLIAGAVVMIVIFMTLLNLRTAIITLISMPLSILFGMMMFPVFGLAINIMSLGGLAVAVGDVVDNAIIFVEIAWRHLNRNAALPKDKRKSKYEVLMNAKSEIVGSISFSSVIILLVFTPVLFLSGLEGQFFRPLGISYMLALLSSLIVAVTITPVLCYIWFRKSKNAATLESGDSFSSRLIKRIYTPILEFCLRFSKTVCAIMAAITLLALWLGKRLGTVPEKDCREMVAAFRELPGKMEEVLSHRDDIQYFASQYFNHDSIFFMGRNLDYALGLEGSLKLKEISYIHSEAYASGELKHGTISLIEDGTLVVALGTYGKLFAKAMSNVVEVKSRGASVLALTTYPHQEEMARTADVVMTIPDIHALLLPILGVVPLQLFAYYVALMRGCDIDKPRNLAKSVTVE